MFFGKGFKHLFITNCIEKHCTQPLNMSTLIVATEVSGYSTRDGRSQKNWLQSRIRRL